jgi:hypothetical protein
MPGRTDPESKTLSKGAMTLSYPLDATVRGIRISASHVGMALLAGEHDRVVEPDNNIVTMPSGGFGIIVPRGRPDDRH